MWQVTESTKFTKLSIQFKILIWSKNFEFKLRYLTRHGWIQVQTLKAAIKVFSILLACWDTVKILKVPMSLDFMLSLASSQTVSHNCSPKRLQRSEVRNPNCSSWNVQNAHHLFMKRRSHLEAHILSAPPPSTNNVRRATNKERQRFTGPDVARRWTRRPPLTNRPLAWIVNKRTQLAVT